MVYPDSEQTTVFTFFILSYLFSSYTSLFLLFSINPISLLFLESYHNRDLAVECARSTVCVSLVACVGEDLHDGGAFFDTALVGEVK